MTTTTHHGAPHVEHAPDELDQACSSDTAKKLVAMLGLTEREARLLLEAPPVSDAEVAAAARVNIHAIAGAFGGNVVSALANEPGLELGVALTRLSQAAAHVHVLDGAIDKLNQLHDRALGNAKLDADTLEQVANGVVPQIRARSRLNPTVRGTFGAIFAYHHARHPGRHAHHDATSGAPATPTNGH